MSPLRVALCNDYEVVLRGLEAMLAEHADRVRVVEVSTSPTVSEEADVILYDTFGRLPLGDDKLTAVVTGNRAAVVVFSWEDYPQSVALEHGAAGYVHKGATALELVAALEAVHAGGPVPAPSSGDETENETGHEQPAPSRWPGQHVGLSRRESEMLSHVARGLTNREIAEHCYLSLNTVKTHIRNAYRKVDVDRRAQAVAWALGNGFGA